MCVNLRLNMVFGVMIIVMGVLGENDILDDKTYTVELKSLNDGVRVYLNPDAEGVKQRLIKVKESLEFKEETVEFEYSISLASPLTEDEIPVGCAPKYTSGVNYVMKQGDECNFGSLSTVTSITLKQSKEGNSEADYIVVRLNSFPGAEDLDQWLYFKSKSAMPDPSKLFYHKRMTTSKPSLGGKPRTKGTLDAYYFAIEPKERKTLEESEDVRELKLGFSIILLLVPGFFIFFFSKDFHYKGVYFLQFGISFNFVSQVYICILDWLNLEDSYIMASALMTFSLYLSYLLSKKKSFTLVIVWYFITLLDYLLLSFLFARSSFIMASGNMAIFLAFAFMIKRTLLDQVKTVELCISFTGALCMLNLWGNCIYFTNTFKRVIFVFQRLQLQGMRPLKYYLVCGGICSGVMLLRALLCERMPWNVQKRDKLKAAQAYDLVSVEKDSFY